jgi:DNA-binding MarR family transcriptional regulator
VTSSERLSEQQAKIVLRLLQHQQRNPRVAMRWEPSRWEQPWSGVRAASMSRSLRRLASRNLVYRIDRDPNRGFRRTEYVYLTEKGLELAETLEDSDSARAL